jgi:hypothetical protein
VSEICVLHAVNMGIKQVIARLLDNLVLRRSITLQMHDLGQQRMPTKQRIRGRIKE